MNQGFGGFRKGQRFGVQDLGLLGFTIGSGASLGCECRYFRGFGFRVLGLTAV